METVRNFIFLGSKITADGDCSHEIKRHSLLGRKAMTSLDSILKSREVTLQTNVRIAKGLVFPVAMYGCESWTIKMTEWQRIDASELWCWRRCLRVTWTTRRSNQSINPEYSLAGLMLKLKLWYLGHHVKNWLIGKDPDSGKDWRREEKGMIEDETVGWHHQLDGCESEQAVGTGNGYGSLACCTPWGCKASDTTEWLNCTEAWKWHLLLEGKLWQT